MHRFNENRMKQTGKPTDSKQTRVRSFDYKLLTQRNNDEANKDGITIKVVREEHKD